MRCARALLLAAPLLAGCATAFPPPALEGVNRAATVAALRADVTPYLGQRALVGGEILATQTRPGQTEIELLSRPLRYDDSPERTDTSDGRALIRTAQFLDPAVFAKGRRITVVGRVTGAEERVIGDLPYRYPVITSEQIRLWALDPPAGVYPYFYPYAGYPWWPWGFGIRPYWYGPAPYPYWWW